MTKEEFRQRWRDLIDGYLKHLANPNNPMRRAGVSFSIEQQAQVKGMLEAGKTVEAQRLILAHLDKELRD